MSKISFYIFDDYYQFEKKVLNRKKIYGEKKIIPVDKNGNVSGGIKVSSFRPYVGIGFGRIVPKNKRVGFLFEIGAQIHGTPEVYTDYGNVDMLMEEADNEFTDVMDKITVYPVMRFRLCGKLF